jgi:5-methylthioadenosine/S-adenosylhomocysteine deaminase
VGRPAPELAAGRHVGRLLRDGKPTLRPVYDPEDVYLGTLLSALGALDAGVTTVFDWAHVQSTPEHTDASIAALRDAGVHAVFGFGPPTAEDRGHRYPDDILRLRREVFVTDDQLLTLALATISPEHRSDEVAKRYWRAARWSSRTGRDGARGCPAACAGHARVAPS